jgi:lipopolysaccharide/colanic/teichoic acid biosynthesis glycosyltransferase
MSEGFKAVFVDRSTSMPANRLKLSPQTMRLRLSLIVMLGDGAAVSIAFYLTWLFSSNRHSTFPILAVMLPLYFGMALNTSAYSMSVVRSLSSSVALAARSLIFSFGALFLLLYFMRAEQQISRWLLLIIMVFSAISLGSFRYLVTLFARSKFKQYLTAEMIIFDGVHVSVPDNLHCINAATDGISPNLGDPIALNRFAALVRDYDRVVIACRPEARYDWAMMLKGANVVGEIIVDDIGAFGAFGMGLVSSHTTLLVSSGPLTLSQRLSKRLFDLTVCIPAIIALAPVLVLTALAVKLDSRGPVFFKQRRVGRGNAFFEIMKFRSMSYELGDVDGSVSTSGRNDQRVTRVGRFIRSTSIDELPQLFNVLSGAMSLVGPRPHALGSLAGSELFWEVDHRYWHRHACKPGLTGLAQVRGFRGATHRREDLINRLQADLEYLNGWSIWRDTLILIATCRVLVHKNAF